MNLLSNFQNSKSCTAQLHNNVLVPSRKQRSSKADYSKHYQSFPVYFMELVSSALALVSWSLLAALAPPS